MLQYTYEIYDNGVCITNIYVYIFKITFINFVIIQLVTTIKYIQVFTTNYIYSLPYEGNYEVRMDWMLKGMLRV